MSRNFLPLISLLIEEVAKVSNGVAAGQLALEAYGTEGTVSQAVVTNSVATTQEFIQLGLLEPGNNPMSCGVTANAICLVFTRRKEPMNSCANIDALKGVVSDGKQRLIRIDLKGHSYVLEQVKAATPTANVYQSNIAVIGNPGIGIGLEEYLEQHSNPVKLLPYLDQVNAVSSSSTPMARRATAYNQLYTTPKVTAPTSSVFQSSAAKCEVNKITWQYFKEEDVLSGIEEIFSAYGNVLGKFRAKKLYYLD
jgi:hypothetical protein